MEREHLQVSRAWDEGIDKQRKSESDFSMEIFNFHRTCNLLNFCFMFFKRANLFTPVFFRVCSHQAGCDESFFYSHEEIRNSLTSSDGLKVFYFYIAKNWTNLWKKLFGSFKFLTVFLNLLSYKKSQRLKNCMKQFT